MAFIFAEEAARRLGRKAIGRDELKRMEIGYADGPVGRGGNRVILVDESGIDAYLQKRAQKKEQYNNEKALVANRFRPTEAAMIEIRAEFSRLHAKIDQLRNERSSETVQ